VLAPAVVAETEAGTPLPPSSADATLESDPSFRV